VTGNNIAVPAADNDADDFEDLFEVAARWDGKFEGAEVSLGTGWSQADLEDAGLFAADIETWNVGINLNWNAFSLGGAYLNSEVGVDLLGGGGVDVERDTWVAGLGWDNGPWHTGLSYINTEFDVTGVAGETEIDRWTAGGTYAFGPGMTFRGAVSRSQLDAVNLGQTDEDAWQYTIGTQVNF
jgi:predicted porin